MLALVSMGAPRSLVRLDVLSPTDAHIRTVMLQRSPFMAVGIEYHDKEPSLAPQHQPAHADVGAPGLAAERAAQGQADYRRDLHDRPSSPSPPPPQQQQPQHALIQADVRDMASGQQEFVAGAQQQAGARAQAGRRVLVRSVPSAPDDFNVMFEGSGEKSKTAITRTMSEFEMLYEFLIAQYSQSETQVPELVLDDVFDDFGQVNLPLLAGRLERFLAHILADPVLSQDSYVVAFSEPDELDALHHQAPSKAPPPVPHPALPHVQGVYPPSHAHPQPPQTQMQTQMRTHLPPSVHFAQHLDTLDSPLVPEDGSMAGIVSVYMDKIAQKDSHIAQLSLRLSELERKLAHPPGALAALAPTGGDAGAAARGAGGGGWGQGAVPAQLQIPVPDLMDAAAAQTVNGLGGGDGLAGGGASSARASGSGHEAGGSKASEWQRQLEAQIAELREQLARSDNDRTKMLHAASARARSLEDENNQLRREAHTARRLSSFHGHFELDPLSEAPAPIIPQPHAAPHAGGYSVPDMHGSGRSVRGAGGEDAAALASQVAILTAELREERELLALQRKEREVLENNLCESKLMVETLSGDLTRLQAEAAKASAAAGQLEQTQRALHDAEHSKGLVERRLAEAEAELKTALLDRANVRSQQRLVELQQDDTVKARHDMALAVSVLESDQGHLKNELALALRDKNKAEAALRSSMEEVQLLKNKLANGRWEAAAGRQGWGAPPPGNLALGGEQARGGAGSPNMITGGLTAAARDTGIGAMQLEHTGIGAMQLELDESRSALARARRGVAEIRSQMAASPSPVSSRLAVCAKRVATPCPRPRQRVPSGCIRLLCPRHARAPPPTLSLSLTHTHTLSPSLPPSLHPSSLSLSLSLSLMHLSILHI